MIGTLVEFSDVSELDRYITNMIMIFCTKYRTNGLKALEKKIDMKFEDNVDWDNIKPTQLIKDGEHEEFEVIYKKSKFYQDYKSIADNQLSKNKKASNAPEKCTVQSRLC